jgi:D-sedoheptulose 7-phosphate isomerase
MWQQVQAELTEAQDVLARFNTPENCARIAAAAQRLAEISASGGRIFSCGNGGSMCDAMHFAEELTGRYRNDRPAIGAVAISDASHLSCVGNDYGYDQVFSRYLEGMARPGDALLAISTSGKSANVLLAAQTARSMGVFVLALTGKDGGPLAQLADIELRVPHLGHADRTQEVHIKIIHSLILLIEQHLAPGK